MVLLLSGIVLELLLEIYEDCWDFLFKEWKLIL
jgi:hypothetical protein